MTLAQDFVAVTDELFQRYRMKKLMIESSAGDWDSYNRRVMEFLSIPLVPEQVVFRGEAMEEEAKRLGADQVREVSWKIVKSSFPPIDLYGGAGGPGQSIPA